MGSAQSSAASPLSHGGLTSGATTAAAMLSCSPSIWAVQPASFTQWQAMRYWCGETVARWRSPRRWCWGMISPVGLRPPARRLRHRCFQLRARSSVCQLSSVGTSTTSKRRSPSCCPAMGSCERLLDDLCALLRCNLCSRMIFWRHLTTATLRPQLCSAKLSM